MSASTEVAGVVAVVVGVVGVMGFLFTERVGVSVSVPASVRRAVRGS